MIFRLISEAPSPDGLGIPPVATPEDESSARITLRHPDRDADNEHTLGLSVEPGQRDRGDAERHLHPVAADAPRQRALAVDPGFAPDPYEDYSAPWFDSHRVLRGGSYLCTDQYCARYLVGSRGKGEVTSGTFSPTLRTGIAL